MHSQRGMDVVELKMLRSVLDEHCRRGSIEPESLEGQRIAAVIISAYQHGKHDRAELLAAAESALPAEPGTSE